MATRPKLSRAAIINAALTFLDREGWDALTINALAGRLGTKGPSLYNHLDSLDDLRRSVRIRVVDDILHLLSTVAAGRTRHDAVMAMASAYRSYALHHPGRYSAFTRMPLGGDDPEFTMASHAAAAPVIEVLASYGVSGEAAYCAALQFWAALHGFVLLEMTGVMGAGVRCAGVGGAAVSRTAKVDTDTVFADMVQRLAAGMTHPQRG